MSNFNIDQALVALGADAEQVASTLEEKGYQGYRHRAHACPIYHYLTDLNFDVSVNPSIISCYGHLDNEEYIATELVITPLAVRRFIFRFDEGGFPELEKK
jgi:hypothetical protein